MIYFLHDAGSGAVKIGVSDQPLKRQAMLQTGNPRPLRLIGTAPGGREHEAELHRRFSAHRLEGEWFRAGPGLMLDIDALLESGIGLNLWGQCKLRDGCRFGLRGVRLRHNPTGKLFECAGSAWDRRGALVVFEDRAHRHEPASLVVRFSLVDLAGLVPPGEYRADECDLLSEWPVTCCPPRRDPS